MSEQQNASSQAGEIYREQVTMAGYELLSDLHDLTYHQGDGQNLGFEVEQYGISDVVENLRSVATRARDIATAAVQALQQAEAGHSWMTSEAPKRCANCGYPIDVTAVDEWRICRDQPEHNWCHRFNPLTSTEADEDSDRASVIEEDEYTAYCEDRERAGGPWHGDSVELVFPDGRTVQGTWYVPGPAPLTAPVVLDWNDTEADPASAQVRVIGLAEDDLDTPWVPSLEDLARGAEMAAALAVPAQPENEQDGDEL
jgi:hypothetical protein